MSGNVEVGIHRQNCIKCSKFQGYTSNIENRSASQGQCKTKSKAKTKRKAISTVNISLL